MAKAKNLVKIVRNENLSENIIIVDGLPGVVNQCFPQ